MVGRATEVELDRWSAPNGRAGHGNELFDHQEIEVAVHAHQTHAIARVLFEELGHAHPLGLIGAKKGTGKWALKEAFPDPGQTRGRWILPQRYATT